MERVLNFQQNYVIFPATPSQHGHVAAVALPRKVNSLNFVGSYKRFN